MISARIADNLARVRDKIAAAARRSGREAEMVRLVAATKYVDDAVARAVFEAGCQDLGESRPQELWRKAEALAGLPVRWHLIGHLQRNKIARTLPLVSLVHSADSWRLIEAIDVAAAELGRTVPLLLEVNISGDATKHGFRPDEVEPLLEPCASLKHVEIRGLMGMSSLEGDLDAARREFASLRQLRDRLQNIAPERISLTELSMGMSDDYEVAIEEGATIVRIGSALFEGID
jgi:pyridoxal phosphate enzyme (YggS family)